jgi:hypothetical protein
VDRECRSLASKLFIEGAPQPVVTRGYPVCLLGTSVLPATTTENLYPSRATVSFRFLEATTSIATRGWEEALVRAV